MSGVTTRGLNRQRSLCFPASAKDARSKAPSAKQKPLRLVSERNAKGHQRRPRRGSAKISNPLMTLNSRKCSGAKGRSTNAYKKSKHDKAGRNDVAQVDLHNFARPRTHRQQVLRGAVQAPSPLPAWTHRPQGPHNSRSVRRCRGSGTIGSQGDPATDAKQPPRCSRRRRRRWRCPHRAPRRGTAPRP